MKKLINQDRNHRSTAAGVISPPAIMTYDAIIFDSDGVLVEPTNPDVHRNAVRKAFIEYGISEVDAETVERLVEITGDHRDQLSAANVKQVCSGYGIDPEEYWRRRELLAAEAQFEEIDRGRKRSYPDIGVLETLNSGSLDLPLGVISNNQHKTVMYALDAFDISAHFDAVYGREPSLLGIERRKPNPYYAERIIHDLEASEPLLVGDSLVDLQTAARLGIDSVFVNRNHREDYELSEQPSYEVDDLEELTEIVSARPV